MSIEQGIYAALTTDSNVNAMNGVAVYANIIPQSHNQHDTAIVFNLIDTQKNYTLGLDDSLHQSRYQLSIWADSKAETEQLSALVITALNKITGTLGGQPVALVLHESSNDLFDDELRQLGKALDFFIYHNS